MNNIELRPEKILVDYLHPYFEHKGFVYIPSQNQFQKKTNFGFHNFVFSITKEDKFYRVNFFIGLRIDLIEIPTYHLAGGLINFDRKSNTLLVPTKAIENNQSSKTGILEYKNLEQYCDYFIDFMDRIGFDFLYTNSKISNLHHLINVNKLVSEKYYNHSFQRCFKGLVACSIVAFDELKNTYKSHLGYLDKRNCPEKYIANFEKLYGVLSTINPN